MSNVKKHEYFDFIKFLIRNKSCKSRSGFLLLEFVITLNVIMISMMAMGHLFFNAVQTQQLAVSKAKLVNAMIGSNDSDLYKQLVMTEDHAQLTFTPQAQRAWYQRWKGRLPLSDLPIMVRRKSIQRLSEKFPISITLTAMKQSGE